ncbi:MAG: WYL domain-containing protein [Candidatus Omnitrophica bacterium]|nr:WYL domain-containing protein [Candidatus Omnitrophota bacterium]
MTKFTIKKSKTGKKKDINQEYLKTVERLIRILSLFDKNKNRTYSTAELADLLQVSQRAIQRDLIILKGAEYPIEEKERGRYAFISNYSLRKAPLTREQESLLSFMAEIAQNLGEKFQEGFRDLFSRLLAEDLYTPFFAKVMSGKMAMPDSSVVRDLEIAIDEFCRIKIEYDKPKEGLKEYTAQPVKIAYFDGYWYLISQNKTGDDVVKFRLERIKKVDLLDETFVVSPWVDKSLHESVNIWFGNKRGERALIEISKDVTRYFKERDYFPLQKIVEEKKDGALVVETFPAHPEEIIHIIMHWLPHLVVLEPDTFKDKVRGMVSKYLCLMNEGRSI